MRTIVNRIMEPPRQRRQVWCRLMVCATRAAVYPPHGHNARVAIAGTGTANQPPPLENYNLFRADSALVEGLRREGGTPWEEQVAAFGEVLGGEPLEWGRLANEHPPQLRTHDRYGERIDEIEFHPAWDSLLRLGLDARVQSLPWIDERPGAHVARAALFMLLAQVEAGVGCRSR